MILEFQGGEGNHLLNSVWAMAILLNGIVPQHPKGAFIYDVRCFLGILDLPANPNQMVY